MVHSLAISCSTPGSVIYYTLDGTTPVTNSAVYAGPLMIDGGATVSAMAAASGYLNSAVRTVFFSLVQTEAPAFSPDSGPITNGASVAISCATPNSTIYYTLDGSEPTTNSAIYSGPIVIDGGTTLSAFATADQHLDSPVSSVFYSLVQTATPDFSPAAGPIMNGTVIAITCDTPGSTIYYTLDGTPPTTNSVPYAGPVTINGGTTLSAFAIAPEHLDSQAQSVFYALVQTVTPVFSPASGPLVYGTNITISCDTPGAVIYYTVDGTAPTTSSANYSAPLVMRGDFTLQAFAVTPGYLDSAVQGVAYTLIQAAQPVFSPAQGPLTNGTLISITSSTTNAIIHYTLDGSDPATNAAVYTAALSFTNPVTLTARAYRADMDTSDPRSAYFGLFDPEPYVVRTLAGNSAAGFVNATGPLAKFSHPHGIALDRFGNWYVADTGNNVIRKIFPSGQVVTLAGTGVAGSQDGAATNAQFSAPVGVFVAPSTVVYVSDGSGLVRKIAGGVVSTVGTLGSANGVGQITVSPYGDIFVGSWATVKRLSPDGTVAIVAGSGGNCDAGWCANVGVGQDTAGMVYAATEYKIWELYVQPLLFAGSVNGFSDGSRLECLLAGPEDIAFDSRNNAFVNELARVRRIDTNGWVRTVAGTGVAGYRNGPGAVAQFNGGGPADQFGRPAAICLDAAGNIYLADSGNNCIRKISPRYRQYRNSGRLAVEPFWSRGHRSQCRPRPGRHEQLCRILGWYGSSGCELGSAH